MKQPSDWRNLERHPLSAEYPDITGDDWERFVANLRKNGIVDDRHVTLHEGMVLDGWQLQRACADALVKPTYKPIPKGMTPEEYVETKNDIRRHESKEVKDARAHKRRMREADLRRQGGSIRDIAAKVGTNPAQVQRDLKEMEAGVSSDTPVSDISSSDDESAPSQSEDKTIGRDGKKYPKAKPGKPKILCDRCARVGAVKGCKGCEAARLAGKVEASPEPAVPVDCVGHGLPDNLIEAFQSAVMFDELLRLAGALQRGIDNVSNTPAGAELRAWLKPTGGEGQTVNKSEHLNALKREIKGTRPHSVCPYCLGEATPKCCGCRGNGWVTQTTWRDAPGDVKANLEVLGGVS